MGAWNCGSCLIQERTNVSGRDLCACLFLHNKGVRRAVKKRYARLGAAADQITQIAAPRVVSAPHLESATAATRPFQRSDQGRPNDIHKKFHPRPHTVSLLLTNLHVINMLQCSSPLNPPNSRLSGNLKLHPFMQRSVPRSLGHRSSVKFGPPPALLHRIPERVCL